MIVRTYGRRNRDLGPSFSDQTLLDAATDDLDLDSKESSFHFPAFSSQDLSPWSLDPDLADDPRRRRGKEARRSPAMADATSTLMEAQEFGEMMEHVDEVNFALDGLTDWRPLRIRRASLLSLLTICGSPQQRMLLRAQGMAKRIIDAILDLNFDDSTSTIAAATLFFVLASDVQDDHLLDSPPCIHFLLKLLNPPKTETVEGRAPTIGSKLLGVRKPQVLGVMNKATDSTSRSIISKVEEILVSCKEIKSGIADDEGMNRPELSSKWISLLTMEKACLSTVSFEDTSEMVRKARGNFKERLRELGGLDAIFDVMVGCHSTMERWSKCKSPPRSELKDGETWESVVLILKCLKILENATFLSKDNQDHLLSMRRKINSEGLSMRFVGVVISSIKFLSGLALLHSLSSSSNEGKSTCLSENVDAHYDHASQVQVKQNTRGHVTYGDIEGSKMRNGASRKRQKLSASSDSGSEMTVAFGSEYSVKKKADCNGSEKCDGISSGSNGDNYKKTTRLKLNISTNGLKMNINANGLKVNLDNPLISIKATGSKTNSCGQSKRLNTSEDVQGECTTDSYDPFAFDEVEFEPSKWDKLARKKETTQTLQITATGKEDAKGCDDLSMDIDTVLSQTTNGDGHKAQGNDRLSVVQGDSNLLEDCLLASVKVLMNLTNDNPVGCQQIAVCGGLDTMVSLVINHFPSYDSCSPVHSQVKEDIASSSQSTSAHNLNYKHLTDHGLDFLVAILGLLVNLVEKDSRNRLRLASARVLVEGPGISEIEEKYMDVIPFLCSIFLANQGAGVAAGEGKVILCDDEALMQGEQEAEMMIVEAYSALLLAFLSTESDEVREAIASCLPNHNLESLVPVLERFVAFHLTLNMISPETHSVVTEVIESCKGP